MKIKKTLLLLFLSFIFVATFAQDKKMFSIYFDRTDLTTEELDDYDYVAFLINWKLTDKGYSCLSIEESKHIQNEIGNVDEKYYLFTKQVNTEFVLQIKNFDIQKVNTEKKKKKDKTALGGLCFFEANIIISILDIANKENAGLIFANEKNAGITEIEAKNNTMIVIIDDNLEWLMAQFESHQNEGKKDGNTYQVIYYKMNMNLKMLVDLKNIILSDKNTTGEEPQTVLDSDFNKIIFNSIGESDYVFKLITDSNNNLGLLNTKQIIINNEIYFFPDTMTEEEIDKIIKHN